MAEIKKLESRTFSRSVVKTLEIEESYGSFSTVTITVGSTIHGGDVFPPPSVFVSPTRAYSRAQWQTICAVVSQLFVAYGDEWSV